MVMGTAVILARSEKVAQGLDDDATKVSLARYVARTIDQNKMVGEDLFTFGAVIGVDRPKAHAKKTATKIRIAHADRASRQISRPADTGHAQRLRVTRRLLHRVAVVRAPIP